MGSCSHQALAVKKQTVLQPPTYEISESTVHERKSIKINHRYSFHTFQKGELDASNIKVSEIFLHQHNRNSGPTKPSLQNAETSPTTFTRTSSGISNFNRWGGVGTTITDPLQRPSVSYLKISARNQNIELEENFVYPRNPRSSEMAHSHAWPMTGASALRDKWEIRKLDGKQQEPNLAYHECSTFIPAWNIQPPCTVKCATGRSMKNTYRPSICWTQ